MIIALHKYPDNQLLLVNSLHVVAVQPVEFTDKTARRGSVVSMSVGGLHFHVFEAPHVIHALLVGDPVNPSDEQDVS